MPVAVANKKKPSAKPSANKPKSKVQPKAPVVEEEDIDLGGPDDGQQEASLDLTETEEETVEETAEEEAAPDDEGGGGDEGESGESEPEETPVRKQPADKGGKVAKQVSPEASDGYDTFEMPIAELTPNKWRTPTQVSIDKMVRAIKREGLLEPIIVTLDGFVLAGNTRLAAYTAMKRATIPARFATDPKTGKPITQKDAAAIKQSIMSNVQRTDVPIVELGKAYAAAIKSGVVAGASELAAELGLTNTELTRTLSVYEKGSPKLHQWLDTGKIGATAAYDVITRCPKHAEQDRILDMVADAETGKVKARDVKASKPARSGKGKRGPKLRIAALSGEVLKTEQTGVSVKLRRVAKDAFNIDVLVTFEATGPNLNKVDLAKKVQAAMAALDPKDVRKELEICRARVND